MVQQGLGKRNCEFPRSLHKSKKPLRGGIHLPFPFNLVFNERKVNLNSVSALLQRIQIRRGCHTNTTNLNTTYLSTNRVTKKTKTNLYEIGTKLQFLAKPVPVVKDT